MRDKIVSDTTNLIVSLVYWHSYNVSIRVFMHVNDCRSYKRPQFACGIPEVNFYARNRVKTKNNNNNHNNKKKTSSFIRRFFNVDASFKNAPFHSNQNYR